MHVYYAHPKFMYNIKYEMKDTEAILKYFPGAKITNPARIRMRHGKYMAMYAYYASLHDVIVYRPVVGRFITAGVFEEICAGILRGAKIARISEKARVITIEEVNKIKDYPLDSKESNLLGRVFKFVDETDLIEEVSDLRSRHKLTPKSALILVSTKILAKSFKKRWNEVLQEFIGVRAEVPRYWLRVIKREEMREKLLKMLPSMKDEITRLILQACLKFTSSWELRESLIKGKYGALPERILAYYYAIKLREENLSYKRIAKELREVFNFKVSPGEVYNWINGKYNPLQKCGRVNDCPELGYVIAAWLGDGSLAVDKRNCKYYVELISTSYEFAKRWGECLAKVTEKSEAYRPRWDKYNKRWMVRASNVLLWMILTIAKEDPWFSYPVLEKYPNLACKGWFDAEGSVNVTGRKIVGTNTDLQQIKLIQKLLLKLSIESKWYSRFDKGTEFKSPRSGKIYKRRRTNYDLVIFGKENHLKYKQLIGFSIPEKQRKLDSLLGKT